MSLGVYEPFDCNPAIIVVDAILHGLVELNPPQAAIKFIRYSLPKIMKMKQNPT